MLSVYDQLQLISQRRENAFVIDPDQSISASLTDRNPSSRGDALADADHGMCTWDNIICSSFVYLPHSFP
jgi:hypothetical protein